MKRLTVVIVALTFMLLLGAVFPAAAGNKSPFIGDWYATDVDGSTVTLAIKGEIGSGGKIFNISGSDNFTGPWCSSRGAGKMKAIGLLTAENSITAPGIWWCLPPGTGTWPADLTLYPFILVYNPSTDTITDNTFSPVTYYRSEDEQ